MFQDLMMTFIGISRKYIFMSVIRCANAEQVDTEVVEIEAWTFSFSYVFLIYLIYSNPYSSMNIIYLRNDQESVFTLKDATRNEVEGFFIEKTLIKVLFIFFVSVRHFTINIKTFKLHSINF